MSKKNYLPVSTLIVAVFAPAAYATNGYIYSITNMLITLKNIIL